MKCSNCKVSVAKKYSFAIKNNQCPACGKHIMQPEKLAAYTRLQELVKNNFSEIDSEKLANLVIANFEIKQLFKEGSLDDENTESEIIVTEVQEDEVELTDEEHDAKHKVKQLREAKKLKRMKEEAYKGALRSQYGMDDIEGEDDGEVTGTGSIFGEKDINTIELADRMEQAQKQNDSFKALESGGASVRRSS